MVVGDLRHTASPFEDVHNPMKMTIKFTATPPCSTYSGTMVAFHHKKKILQRSVVDVSIMQLAPKQEESKHWRVKKKTSTTIKSD